MRRRCPAVVGFLVAFLMTRASVAAPRTGVGAGGGTTHPHARLGAGTVARAADEKPTLGDVMSASSATVFQRAVATFEAARAANKGWFFRLRRIAQRLRAPVVSRRV